MCGCLCMCACLFACVCLPVCACALLVCPCARPPSGDHAVPQRRRQVRGRPPEGASPRGPRQPPRPYPWLCLRPRSARGGRRLVGRIDVQNPLKCSVTIFMIYSKNRDRSQQCRFMNAKELFWFIWGQGQGEDTANSLVFMSNKNATNYSILRDK